MDQVLSSSESIKWLYIRSTAYLYKKLDIILRIRMHRNCLIEQAQFAHLLYSWCPLPSINVVVSRLSLTRYLNVPDSI